MGSVLLKTQKYRELFPDDFKKENNFGDLQVLDIDEFKKYSYDKGLVDEFDKGLTGGGIYRRG